MRSIRRLTIDDIPRVLEIQAAAYAPHLLEAGEVFAAKIRSHPGWCLGSASDDGVLAAYVITFPMSSTESVGLHETATRSVVADGECPILYIHDMAVHPSFQANGHGGRMLHALEDLARRSGQTVIEMVAIESAVSFWERNGFNATDDEVYTGYGHGARKMRRTV